MCNKGTGANIDNIHHSQTGNVGIGVPYGTELLDKLVVDGSMNINYDGVALSIYRNGDENQTYMYISGFGDRNFSIMAYSAENNMGISFITGSGSNRMRITKDVNVGIGTTSPSHKLEVDGDIKFTGTLYDANGAFSNHNDANRLNCAFLKEPVAPADTITNIQEPTIISNIQKPTSSPSITPIAITGTEYKYMTFTYTSGVTNTPYTITFEEDTECDILVVGAGGGGGHDRAGGGGAGACLFDKNYLMNGNYTVNVGKGGLNVSSNNGQNGNDSSISNSEGRIFLSKGGGGGGAITTVGVSGECVSGAGSQGNFQGGGIVNKIK